AYDSLGDAAADWLAREGRGPYVETVARTGRIESARSSKLSTKVSGELRVLFSLRGVPMSAMWLADDPFLLTRNRAERSVLRRQALMRMFVPGGVRETEFEVLGNTLHLAAIPGAV